jgi:hypothetical protein
VYLHVEQQFVLGVLQVVVYVPYWYTDLTDLGLVISEDRKHEAPRALLPSDATERSANIFSITDPKRQKIRVRSSANKSLWSKEKLVIDSLGSRASVQVPQEAGKAALELGVRITGNAGKYHRTKHISFTSRYHIINKLDETLEIRPSVDPQPHKAYAEVGDVLLSPGQRTPFFGSGGHQGEAQMIKLRLKGDREWSGNVKINATGSTKVRIRRAGTPVADDGDGTEARYCRVDVRLADATIYVVLQEVDRETLDWALPVRVENRCIGRKLRFRQMNVFTPDTSANFNVLKPFSHAMYTWDQPVLAKRLLEVKSHHRLFILHTLRTPYGHSNGTLVTL